MPRKNVARQNESEVAEVVENAPEVTVESTGSKRGRKATNVLTLAKFTAAVKSGNPLPGMEYHPQVFNTPPTPPTWAGYTARIVEVTENGLAIVELATEGRAQKVVTNNRRVYTFDEVLAALTPASE